MVVHNGKAPPKAPPAQVLAELARGAAAADVKAPPKAAAAVGATSSVPGYTNCMHAATSAKLRGKAGMAKHLKDLKEEKKKEEEEGEEVEKKKQLPED